ncbi:PAS domain-containing protein [Flaviaesturariibacter flavus]|uniref:histidine kinase n=1 Tax=Flaviaesturariibacter flavus TaxID=2502780 RepID=A0A4R1B6V7_9BACT|nr:PAS domain-containing protein [Flaviaesturariibacter flavus]TCJ12088.1 PAS domain-containing protein [Flaviaesturariibacter flavus]
MHHSHSSNDSDAGRVIYLFLDDHSWKLEGRWQWPAASTALFGSDVAAEAPEFFEGTRGILHPDDVASLRTALELANGKPLRVRFRLITTYGSVLPVEGVSVNASAAGQEQSPEPVPPWREAEERSTEKKEAARLRYRATAADLAERQSGTGTWYYNAGTGEAWYSDNCYRLHGLQPQSSNAHLFTFAAYVHPADAHTVEDSFDRAYRRRLPLDITYRIQTAGHQERSIRLCTSWSQDEAGADILYALLQDCSEQAALEEQLAEANDRAQERHEALCAAERLGYLGSWALNAHTGKWSFSDHYYRLLGLQPRSVEPSDALLLQYVHPDDREMLAEACRRFEDEHVSPELEYRALRNDGQVRHLQLRGRTALLPSGELLLIGSVRDITLQHALERREARWRETAALREEVQHLGERAAAGCTWTWDIRHDKMEWSPGFYELLGYKPNSLPLTQKLLSSFLHPDDRKKFSEHVNTVLQTKGAADLQLRLQTKDSLRYLNVHLQVLRETAGAHFVATFHDETALRQEQHAGAERERLLAVLANTFTGKLLITDGAHTITRINDGAQKWLQGRGKNAVGQNLFEVIPRLRAHGFQELLNRALKGVSGAMPSLLPGDAGGTHHVVPVADGSGCVTAVLHLLREASPPAEAGGVQLAEKLADAVPERIIVLDRHMNYQVWNEACEKHYGLSRGAVLGHNLLEVAPGFIDDPGYQEFKRALKGETVHLSGDGDPAHPVDIALVPVPDEEGNVAAVLWVAGNNTEATGAVRH